MKTILKIILITQLFLLSSCGVRRIYTSGSYGSLKSFTAKKEYSGERSSEIYVSGDLSTGKHEQEKCCKHHHVFRRKGPLLRSES